MGNSLFEFKKFTIQQSQCSMKVTEDACIQGAWTKIGYFPKHILDIGSGTGLLSLMLAQKFPSTSITCYEIDEASYKQGKENIELASKTLPASIECIHADIKTIDSNIFFDIIICNPPFYEKHLPSSNTSKNIAWHSEHLQLKDIIEISNKLLTQQGIVSILLPYFRLQEIEHLATTCNMYLQHVLYIRHNENKSVHRVVVLLGKENQGLVKETLCVRHLDNTYTTSMKHLLKNFYTKF